MAACLQAASRRFRLIDGATGRMRRAVKSSNNNGRMRTLSITRTAATFACSPRPADPRPARLPPRTLGGRAQQRLGTKITRLDATHSPSTQASTPEQWVSAADAPNGVTNARISDSTRLVRRTAAVCAALSLVAAATATSARAATSSSDAPMQSPIAPLFQWLQTSLPQCASAAREACTTLHGAIVAAWAGVLHGAGMLTQGCSSTWAASLHNTLSPSLTLQAKLAAIAASPALALAPAVALLATLFLLKAVAAMLSRTQSAPPAPLKVVEGTKARDDEVPVETEAVKGEVVPVETEAVTEAVVPMEAEVETDDVARLREKLSSAKVMVEEQVAANEAAGESRTELLEKWRAAEQPALAETKQSRPRDFGPGVTLLVLAEIFVEGMTKSGVKDRPTTTPKRFPPSASATTRTTTATTLKSSNSDGGSGGGGGGPGVSLAKTSTGGGGGVSSPAPSPLALLPQEPPSLPPSRLTKAVQEGAMTAEVGYMAGRLDAVRAHFPTALVADDLLFRLERALCAFGFDGDNSIGVVNLCRDEATNPLRQKIEAIYPLLFNINGLGGGLTCGVTGMKAGLSHAPKQPRFKKRYIFVSAPHIAIDAKGRVGSMARPGQQTTNCACGALIAALGEFRKDGLGRYLTDTEGHSPPDPEYSILKQRLAKRIKKAGKQVEKMGIVEFTRQAERQISDDLRYLIGEAVDVSEADYAIVTGVQIHSWGDRFDGTEPNLELLATTRVAVVVDGRTTEIDLEKVPAPSARQLRRVLGRSETESTESAVVFTGRDTVSTLGSGSALGHAGAGRHRQRELGFAGMLETMSDDSEEKTP